MQQWSHAIIILCFLFSGKPGYSNIFVFWLESHRSCWLSLFFFVFSLFASNRIISKFLASKSFIVFHLLYSTADSLYCIFSFHSLVLFYDFCLLGKFFILILHIFFAVSMNGSSGFSCGLLNFFKIAISNSARSQNSVPLGSVFGEFFPFCNGRLP